MKGSNYSRRRFLAVTGATAAISALAGCGGGGDGGDGGEEDGAAEDTPTEEEATPTEEEETPTEEEDTPTEEEDTPTEGEEETPTDGGNDTADGDGGGAGDSPEGRLITYLEADPAARAFEGEIVDETGSDEVTVQVGAGSDGLAFDPPGLRVSSGTTVVWEWTGQGGAHNVSSTASDTYDGDFQSDFEFRSGDPVGEEGTTFEQSFDETGVGLYRCEPHASVGMKGGFAVVE